MDDSGFPERAKGRHLHCTSRYPLYPQKRTFGSQNSPSEIEEIHDCLAPRHHILIAELDKFANILWLKKQIAGEAPLCRFIKPVTCYPPPATDPILEQSRFLNDLNGL